MSEGKVWCSISRDGVEKIANELWELEHPGVEGMDRISQWIADKDWYMTRVYQFDTALQRLGYVLVKGA